MLDIVSVYEDVKFRINGHQNGDLSYPKFNGASRLAELSLIDWLSGDISGIQPPEPYLTQKNSDWLTPLIAEYKTHVNDGIFYRPEDYYGFENMFKIGSKVDHNCEADDDDDEKEDSCNTKIELMSSNEFDGRCVSHIEGLQPTMELPISKQIGRKFYVAPQALGSITLEYIRYPKFGKIVTKKDDVYNQLVPDLSPASGTTHYEWDENVRQILIFFIADEFSNHTRENALKQMNKSTGKLTRDGK